MVSGSRVDPGNYTQQWPLQAPIPSSMLGTKSGLFLKHRCFFVFGILGASVCHGEWIPCRSWKLHPTVASTSPSSLKHAWNKNRPYFLKIGCFLFLVFLGLLCAMVSGSRVAPGNYTQQWPLQAPNLQTRLGQNRAYFLKIGCFFWVFLGASVWHGEWIPCRSWKLHPTVASTSPSPFKHAWNKNRAYFLKIGRFLVFLGLLCGMVSGSPVAPGNYTQQ